jgi:hypothetical protein
MLTSFVSVIRWCVLKLGAWHAFTAASPPSFLASFSVRNRWCTNDTPCHHVRTFFFNFQFYHLSAYLRLRCGTGCLLTYLATKCLKKPALHYMTDINIDAARIGLETGVKNGVYTVRTDTSRCPFLIPIRFRCSVSASSLPAPYGPTSIA